MNPVLLKRTLKAGTTLGVSISVETTELYERIAKRHHLGVSQLPYFISVAERLSKDHPDYRVNDIRGLAVIAARVAKYNGGDIAAAVNEQLSQHRHHLAISVDAALIAPKEITTLLTCIKTPK